MNVFLAERVVAFVVDVTCVRLWDARHFAAASPPGGVKLGFS
jgi:hypothetical protein